MSHTDSSSTDGHEVNFVICLSKGCVIKMYGRMMHSCIYSTTYVLPYEMKGWLCTVNFKGRMGQCSTHETGER
jgi:hypothetical protein